MSWISDLAGKAENLLIRFDSEAATVLSKEKRNSGVPGIQSAVLEGEENKTAIAGSSGALSSSRSVPANLTSYGSTKLTSLSLKQSPKKRTSYLERASLEKERREELSQSTTSSTEIKNLQLETKYSEELSVNISHSRQSSGSSASSYLNVSGSATPAFTTLDMDTSSAGSNSGSSVNADAYINIDTPSDIPISAPSTTNSSTSDNGNHAEKGASVMTSSVDSETSLLRKEVTSLNQEMTQVLKRAKESEKEVNKYKSQLSIMSQQQSRAEDLLRDLQQRELDLVESLKVKDSQLAVLKVRLQEADEQLKTTNTMLSNYKEGNERLLEDVSKSNSVHSEAFQSFQARLNEALSALEREKMFHETTKRELSHRVTQLEEEQKGLMKDLTDSQRRVQDEKQKAEGLNLQNLNLKAEVSSACKDLIDYKAKASRILQSKDKLIANLKEGGESGGVHFTYGDSFLQAEMEQIRGERDLLREELDRSSELACRLRAEVVELESLSQQQLKASQEDVAHMEDIIAEERSLKVAAQEESHIAEHERKCLSEELTRQKLFLSSKIEERDTEIQRLQKQVAYKQSSMSTESELEKRLNGLTESLIHKQTTIEALITEKTSVHIQMERLKQQYEESQKLLNRDLPSLPQDEARSRVPSFLVESPFDGGVARHVKKAYGSLDKFSIRLGVFLRRYPIARVFVILYMFLLHSWVMVVLLTYKPEIHGQDFKETG